jgi:RHS repeat-associated protein
MDQTTNSGGTAVEYSYDPTDNLTDTTVVDSAVWTTNPYSEDLTNLTLNPDSLIATSTPASGTSTTLDYDADDRILAGLGDSYTYDADGRLTSDSPTSGSATYNSYDTGSELCATQDGSSPSCTFPGSSTTVYGYDSAGDRCYAATGSTAGICSSPPAGSTLETFGWDQAGHMTCVTVANSSDATCSSPNSTYSSTYVYNGDGLRVADSPAGGSQQQFTWDATTSVPRLIRDGTNEYLYGPDSTTPIEQVNMSMGSTSFNISDNQGVRLVVALNGDLTGTEDYNSYGTTSGSIGTPFQFSGGYSDPTGLNYLVNRYYDPATGQFLSVDPVVSITGQPYSYAGDDPVNGGDPTGLEDVLHNHDTCTDVDDGQWSARLCVEVNTSPFLGENERSEPQAVWVATAGTIENAGAKQVNMEVCGNTGPFPGHPRSCHQSDDPTDSPSPTCSENKCYLNGGWYTNSEVNWEDAWVEGAWVTWEGDPCPMVAVSLHETPLVEIGNSTNPWWNRL